MRSDGLGAIAEVSMRRECRCIGLDIDILASPRPTSSIAAASTGSDSVINRGDCDGSAGGSSFGVIAEASSDVADKAATAAAAATAATEAAGATDGSSGRVREMPDVMSEWKETRGAPPKGCCEAAKLPIDDEGDTDDAGESDADGDM